jgi:hypothetical protein
LALDDPRSATRSRHKLVEMITIAIAPALSGADGWVGVETFAKGKEAWLRSFLERGDKCKLGLVMVPEGGA